MSLGHRPHSQTRRARSTCLRGLMGMLFAMGLWGADAPIVAGQPPDTPAPSVAVAEVTPRTVPIYEEFVARTQAAQTVELHARVEGSLEQVRFQEGSLVQKGQLLFIIERLPYEAALLSARAQLAQAQADLTRAQEHVEVLRVRAQLAQQQAALAKARQDVARLRPLVRDRAVPQQDLDAALASEQVAAAEVQAAEAALKNTELQERIGILQAQAAVEAAQAAVTQAEINLSYTTIQAPMDGIIGFLAVDQGNEVNGAENMIYVTSRSSSDGRYVLTCTFAVGTDVDLAAVDIQNRVSRAQGDLPNEVNTYGISVREQSPDMLMVFSVYSPDRTYDEIFLSNYTTVNLIDPLTRVPGVGSTTVVGGGDYAMRLWVRPDKLAEAGLTASDIVNAVQEQSVQVPAGQMRQRPAPPGTLFQYTVNVPGRLSTMEEYDNLILRALPNGEMLRLRDVGRSELGAETYTSFGRYNAVPSTLVIIFQLPGANALDTVEGVKATMAQLSQNFPPGLQYEVVMDNTLLIQASIEEVLKTLFEAMALVLVVVFVFLGTFRSTFIPMLAIPASLVGTFAVFVPSAPPSTP